MFQHVRNLMLKRDNRGGVSVPVESRQEAHSSCISEPTCYSEHHGEIIELFNSRIILMAHMRGLTFEFVVFLFFFYSFTVSGMLMIQETSGGY